MKKFYSLLIILFSVHLVGAQCSHTFNMYDSYGDGWNGSAVDITVNGTAVVSGATITSAQGASNSETFSASTGDAIALANWVTGSWTGEVSWDITDGNGTVILSGNFGSTSSGSGYCPPPPPCSHSFVMFDSYGDGWNGSAVDVTVNGVTVVTAATITSSQGSTNTETFSATTGDAIALANWVTGSWTGEVSWELKDGANNTIATGVFNGTTGGSGFCPSCSPPSSLSTSNATGNSIDLAWVAGGSETAWNIEYGSMGFSPGNGTTVNVTSTSYSLTGLNMGSNYDFYVQADCGGSTSNFTGPFSFNTLIDSAQGVTCSTGSPTYVFSDDMSSNNGWTGDIGLSNGQWDFPTSGPNSTLTGPSSAFTGSGYAEYEASGANIQASMVSPMIDLGTASGGAELSFYMHAYGANIGTLDVGISNSASGPFTNLFSWTGQYHSSASDPWTQVGIDISSYIGQQVFVEFSYISVGSSYTGDLAIDFVRVQSCVGCVAPSNLMASNISASSADLTWSAGGTETVWELTYGPAGFTPGSGTLVPMLTDSSYNLTNLTSNTSYDFFVKADCGSSNLSSWAGPYNFNTLCGVFNAPYLDNFDSGLSNCWIQSNQDNFDWTLDANGTTTTSTGPSDDISGGGNYLYIETSSPRVNGDSAVIFSPSINLDSLSNPQLRFFNHMYGSNTELLKVGISKD